MAEILINKEKCINCGLCVKICPMYLFEIDSENGCQVKQDNKDYCLTCGHCMSICPKNAIMVDQHTVISSAGSINPDKLRLMIQSRRSIRHFQNEKLDKKQIKELIDTVRWAPTGKNTQQVFYTVIQTPEAVKEMSGIAMEWFRQKEDLKSLVQAWEKGVDMINRGAPHLIVTHSPHVAVTPQADGVIALTLLDLYAQAKGYGTCWAGFFMMACAAYPPLCNALNLPENHSVTGAMMLGYPEMKFLCVPPRNAPAIQWM